MKDYLFQKYLLPAQIGDAVLNEWKEKHSVEMYNINRTRQGNTGCENIQTYALRESIFPRGMMPTQQANCLNCQDTPLYEVFPAVRKLINWAGEHRGGWSQIGRIIVAEMAANSEMYKHIDSGAYYDKFDRHHFVLQSEDTRFHWDEASVQCNPGDMWMFNNSVRHWVTNGTGKRMHLIFDAV